MRVFQSLDFTQRSSVRVETFLKHTQIPRDERSFVAKQEDHNLSDKLTFNGT